MSDEFARIDRLIQVGLRLARSATSGRVLLARIAAAVDPRLMPPEGEGLLRELQAARAAACEPLALRQVERALRDAWGTKPAEELDELESEPVATTPTSQVHRGVLEGKPVAVKVLRPGLEASVRQDLALLDGLMRPLATAFPALDPGAVLGEFRERVLEELDLEHEAMVQRRFHRALRRHEYLSAPAPVTRLCHPGVLISEWVDGVPLARLEDADGAAARLVVFVLGSARSGTVYADVEPEDVLVREDGRLAVLDYGLTRAALPDRLASAAAAVEAFTAEDAEAFAAALERLGALPGEHAPLAMGLVREGLGPMGGPEPVRLDVDAVRSAVQRVAARPRDVARLLVEGTLVSDDVWPAVAVGGLFGTIARVGATAPWREIVRAALRDGWDVPDPARAEAGRPGP